jgi:hypothetical protein
MIVTIFVAFLIESNAIPLKIEQHTALMTLFSSLGAVAPRAPALKNLQHWFLTANENRLR